MGSTYIGVLPKLLDGGILEMARVAKEVASNLEGVGETTVSVVGNGEVTALPKLNALLLTITVELLDPGLVIRSARVAHMLLELDNVGVGDLLSICRGKERCDTIVDGLVAERWRCQHGGGRIHQGEGEGGLHDDGCVGAVTCGWLDG